MKDEALRLALEALESSEGELLKARAKIKQALKQPEPEPVAWVDLLKEAQKIAESKPLWKRFIDGTPLANDIACWMADFAKQHTSPPKREWQGLTDVDVSKILDEQNGFYTFEKCFNFAKAIEAKLKEKNT